MKELLKMGMIVALTAVSANTTLAEDDWSISTENNSDKSEDFQGREGRRGGRRGGEQGGNFQGNNERLGNRREGNFQGNNERLGNRRGGKNGQGGMNSEQRDKMKKKFFSSLSEEEQEKLKGLKKSNPEEFRKEINKIADKLRSEHKTQKAKRNELKKQYLEANSEEKAKIKEELRKEYKILFDEKMKKNREKYDRAKEKMEEYKQQLEERERNADKIIELKLEEELKNPSLRW